MKGNAHLPNDETTRAESRISALRHFILVAAGAVMVCWPAFLNRFPLLYPDSMTYLDDGRRVARALFLRQFSNYYGMRSFLYSLVILPLHRNANPWPVIALQSLLTAYVLWLVVRSLLPRRRAEGYLSLVLLLSLLTSMSWYVTLILPDILGDLLYLAIYLIVFARDTLSPAERMSLYLIAWWGVASHATHLLLAAGLCMTLALVFIFRRESRRRFKSVGEIAAIVVLAAASQLALHAYLYGKPSLNGERPAFLTARIIADGPGRWYLEQHCGGVKWVICRHLNKLSDDPDVFLWGEDGFWQNLSTSEQEQVLREEMPFVLATLRTYPRQQLGKSAGNFGEQLRLFGLYDLDPSGWVLETFDQVLPGERANYVASRQARNVLPLEFFTNLQFWIVIASAVTVMAFLPRLWIHRSHRTTPLAGLTLIVVFVIFANAMITGTLSMPEDRLQSRIVWLVPMLAILFVMDWMERRSKSPRGSVSQTRQDSAETPPHAGQRGKRREP